MIDDQIALVTSFSGKMHGMRSWNWGLADRNFWYRNYSGDDRYTTAINQNKEIVRLKHNTEPWLKEISKKVPRMR